MERTRDSLLGVRKVSGWVIRGLSSFPQEGPRGNAPCAAERAALLRALLWARSAECCAAPCLHHGLAAECCSLAAACSPVCSLHCSLHCRQRCAPAVCEPLGACRGWGAWLALLARLRRVAHECGAAAALPVRHAQVSCGAAVCGASLHGHSLRGGTPWRTRAAPAQCTRHARCSSGSSSTTCSSSCCCCSGSSCSGSSSCCCSFISSNGGGGGGAKGAGQAQ
jgi:hypothetical protein